MPALTVVDQAQIDTNPASVTDTILPSSPQITVDPNSVTIVNGPGSVSYYDGSLTALGIGAGLLITSGTVPGLVNTVPWFGADNGMAGDPDLDAVVNTVFATTSYDATSLSLNFEVTDPSVTGISFKIVFGTDEYPEWVDQFVDIAVVMVNGVNVAYFGNNPAAPLSVIGSNLAAGYFIDNADGHLPIEYDGVSNVLTVFAPVHFGTNSLKIAIADTGDHIYDSGLFISGFTATNVPVSGVNLDIPCTEGNDDKVGTIASESIDGLGGDDNLDGAGGDDVVLGGAGVDTLQGGAGKDFLDGGSGQDSVDGGADDDTIQFSGQDAIQGGAGVDTLKIDASGLGGPATLDISDPAAVQTLADGSTVAGVEVLQFTGGAEADAVTGGTYADAINAGAGDDTIAGGGGDDQIDGGDGVDTAIFQGLSSDYQVTALPGGGLLVKDMSPGGADGVDTLSGVEVLAFADGAFTAQDLVIAGAEIHGTAGDDRISATEAPAGQPFATSLGDTVFSDTGDDVVSTGAGDDVVYAGANNDIVDAGAGDDVIVGEGGDDEITGGAGTDAAVFSGAYADYAIAPSGDGWTVTDNRPGSPDGFDQLVGVEQLVFSDVTVTVGLGAPPEVVGGDLSGALAEPGAPAGTQTLSGAIAFIDADHDDTHTVEVAASTGDQAGVVFTPTFVAEPTDAASGAVAWSLEVDPAALEGLAEGQVRTLTYTVRINDSGGNHVDQVVSFTLTGTNDAPVVSGPATASAAEDGAAAAIDALANASDVDAGAKLMVVGVQADLPAGVTYDAKTHSFVLDPTDAAYQSLAAGQQATVSVAYGVSDGLAVTPAQAQFTVTGVNDAPVLAAPLADAAGTAGTAFAYQVAAGAFTDADGDALALSATLADGSALPSWLAFDAASGAFSGAPTSAGDYQVKVTAADGFGASASDVFILSIAAPAGQTLTGTAGADVLTGTAFDDQILGLGGADSLKGLDGNDVLDGGAGNDLLDGGAGIDTASYASASAGVTVSLAIGKAQSTGGSGKDILANIENLTGSDFADTLTGAGGHNVLAGGGGADTLAGAGGADDLWGGAGADRFIFNALSDSAVGARDVIHDFSHAEGDRIDLSHIDAIAGGKDQAFSFVSAFTHKAGQLVSVFDTDHYVVQGDVNGDGVADFAIDVFSPTALVSSDFLF